MGVFNAISLVLLALQTFAAPDSLYEKLKEPNKGKKWVVLVSGSRGYDNYRHQADICHAYQIVLKNGIPKDNIITMMMDDIAYNKNNPTPGIIINKPNGTNVYAGVNIDYRGLTVTPHNFLNVITGNKRAMRYIGTGKVILGGPLDTIFINFVDHGSYGVLGFPYQLLYADQLNSALKKMHSKRSYKEMLIYIEACYAGSMFEGMLGNHTNVVAVTAANPVESSYGCYCDDESGIYETCLGDTFSVSWMEDDDEMELKSPSSNITVLDQYKIVKKQVKKSHVTLYGDRKTASKTLYTFIGNSSLQERKPASKAILADVQEKVTVSSRDLPKHTIEYMIGRTALSSDKKIKLQQKLRLNNKMRYIIDSVLRNILSEIEMSKPDIKIEIGEINRPNQLNLSLDIFPCYRSILDQITESCFSVPENPYTFQKLRIFANLCIVDKHINQMVQDIIVKSCANISETIINVF